jgi:hypothetical protein
MSFFEYGSLNRSDKYTEVCSTNPKEDQTYSRFQLCNDMEPKEKCFRLRRYNQGVFEDVFHEHVLKHRISLDRGIEMMKALVLRHGEFAALYILRCYLNSRGRDPEAYHFQINIKYPEPGVIRRYCGSYNVQAWMDEVIVPGKFRQLAPRHEKKFQKI